MHLDWSTFIQNCSHIMVCTKLKIDRLIVILFNELKFQQQTMFQFHVKKLFIYVFSMRAYTYNSTYQQMVGNEWHLTLESWWRFLLTVSMFVFYNYFTYFKINSQYTVAKAFECPVPSAWCYHNLSYGHNNNPKPKCGNSEKCGFYSFALVVKYLA